MLRWELTKGNLNRTRTARLLIGNADAIRYYWYWPTHSRSLLSPRNFSQFLSLFDLKGVRVLTLSSERLIKRHCVRKCITTGYTTMLIWSIGFTDISVSTKDLTPVSCWLEEFDRYRFLMLTLRRFDSACSHHHAAAGNRAYGDWDTFSLRQIFTNSGSEKNFWAKTAKSTPKK